MSEYEALAIALLDAASNCEREGALATLTLRSGIEFKGVLERYESGAPTAHVKLKHVAGTERGEPFFTENGWAAIRIEEIAAVSSSRP